MRFYKQSLDYLYVVRDAHGYLGESGGMLTLKSNEFPCVADQMLRTEGILQSDLPQRTGKCEHFAVPKNIVQFGQAIVCHSSVRPMGLYASVYFILVNVLCELLLWLTLCALQKQEGCFNPGRVAASLPPKCTRAEHLYCLTAISISNFSK